jgi:hypothetical protein
MRDMHGGFWSEEFVRERNARALAEAEERRLARLAAGATPPASLRMQRAGSSSSR